MDIFISIAVSELRTLLNIETPNSLKAYGMYLGCCPLPLFKVLKLHLKDSHSSFVNSNMKSGAGKRLILFFTDRFRYFVSVPYISAKSKSSITFCPRISYILLCINCSCSISFYFDVDILTINKKPFTIILIINGLFRLCCLTRTPKIFIKLYLNLYLSKTLYTNYQHITTYKNQRNIKEGKLILTAILTAKVCCGKNILYICHRVKPNRQRIWQQ